MQGWLISAQNSSSRNDIIQSYGIGSQFYYFTNTGNIPRGAVVNFTPNGNFATAVTWDGSSYDAQPVVLSYAPQ
jgi:hypothetical protein